MSQFHVNATSHQLQQMYWGMMAALVLNRTYVMPRVSWCDACLLVSLLLYLRGCWSGCLCCSGHSAAAAHSSDDFVCCTGLTPICHVRRHGVFAGHPECSSQVEQDEAQPAPHSCTDDGQSCSHSHRHLFTAISCCAGALHSTPTESNRLCDTM